MRILSLHPATTELVFALGAGNMLVGRTDSCSYPEAALNVPSIGKMAEITPEMTTIFEPDLVLLGQGQEQLQHMGVNVLLFAPQSLEEMTEEITRLGERLGKQVEADMVINDMQSAFERISAKVKRFRTIRVYCEQETPLLASALLMELICLAGGESCGIEALKEFNPQLIIVVAHDDSHLELIAGRWSQLQAVQHERLFRIDEGLLRPTPRIAEGARLLAKIMHGVEIGGE